MKLMEFITKLLLHLVFSYSKCLYNSETEGIIVW